MLTLEAVVNATRSNSVEVQIVVINTIAPVFIDDQYRFTMNAQVSGQNQNVVVGSVRATDGNFEAIRYQIDSDSTLLNGFNVNPVNGILFYEGLGEPHDTPAMLVVRARDAQNNFDIVSVRIDFVGLRFIPPAAVEVPYGMPWKPPQYTFDLSLGQPFNEMTDSVGHVIAFGTVQATDSDGNAIEYFIDNDLFIIGRSDGELSYNDLRGERQDIQLTVTVRASELTETAAVLVRVVNDSMPVFDGQSYTFNLPAERSGTPSSFIIGSVQATDANRNQLIYSVDKGSNEEAFDTRFAFSDDNRVLSYIGSGEAPNVVFNITVFAYDAPDGMTASANVHIRVGATTMQTRTSTANMALSQVVRGITISTVDVVGSRFSAAPHLTISGNALQSKWQHMRRLKHWGSLQKWQSIGDWNGKEREFNSDWLKNEMGLGFVDNIDNQWDAFRANLIKNSSFLLRVGAKKDEASNETFGYGGKGSGGWSFWGKGRYSGYENTQGSHTVKGSIVSFYLGLDYELHDSLFSGDRLLLGLAVARSNSDGTFENSADTGQNADLDTSVNSVYPYLQWGSGSGFELWSMFGAGIGTVEVSTIDESYTQYTTDLFMQNLAGGIKQVLLVGGQDINSTEISLKADAFVVNAETEAVDTVIEASEVSSHRFRLALQDSRRWKFQENITYSGDLELGGRFDGGDGVNGYGLDMGLGLGYQNARSGISINSQGRVLLLHTQEDSSEWGLEIAVRIRPRSFRRGVSFTLEPGWGKAITKIDALWQHGASASLGTTNADLSQQGWIPDRTELSLSYGLPYHSALLHPFVDMGMEQDTVAKLKMGLKAEFSSMDLEIVADRQQNLEIGWGYHW